MSDPGQKSPTEVVMDLAVYAPLGLALTVSEVVPQLIDKGRARFGPQVALARSIGEFAVRQGAQQLRASGGRARLGGFPRFPFRAGAGRFGWWGDRSAGAGGAAGEDVAAHPDPAARAAGDRPAGTVDLRARGSGRGPGPGTGYNPSPGDGATAGGRAARAAAEGTGGDAAGLAIPSYDSLSASQVVQRLAGLSREEVEAVRAYEARTRGRRTVLARAEQLLA